MQRRRNVFPTEAHRKPISARFVVEIHGGLHGLPGTIKLYIPKHTHDVHEISVVPDRLSNGLLRCVTEPGSRGHIDEDVVLLVGRENAAAIGVTQRILVAALGEQPSGNQRHAVQAWKVWADQYPVDSNYIRPPWKPGQTKGALILEGHSV